MKVPGSTFCASEVVLLPRAFLKSLHRRTHTPMHRETEYIHLGASTLNFPFEAQTACPKHQQPKSLLLGLNPEPGFQAVRKCPLSKNSSQQEHVSQIWWGWGLMLQALRCCLGLELTGTTCNLITHAGHPTFLVTCGTCSSSLSHRTQTVLISVAQPVCPSSGTPHAERAQTAFCPRGFVVRG